MVEYERNFYLTHLFGIPMNYWKNFNTVKVNISYKK